MLRLRLVSDHHKHELDINVFDKDLYFNDQHDAADVNFNHGPGIDGSTHHDAADIVTDDASSAYYDARPYPRADDPRAANTTTTDTGSVRALRSDSLQPRSSGLLRRRVRAPLRLQQDQRHLLHEDLPVPAWHDLSADASSGLLRSKRRRVVHRPANERLLLITLWLAGKVPRGS
jgi:hypothetical protein